MNKKQLIDEVSLIIKDEVNDEVVTDNLGKHLNKKIFNLNFFHVIIYVIFLLLSVFLFHKIDHLSFINEDFYIVLLVFFIVVSTIISIIFFTLYIYNKKKNKLIGLNQMKKTFKFYQIYDLFSFVSIFISIFLWVVIFVVTPVEVSGESMEDTFYDKDKILVWHIGYEPIKDDVVIINSEEYLNTEFIIKRVIATSGDVVSYSSKDLTVSVNGVVVASNVKRSQYQTMLTDKENNKTYFDEGIVPDGFSIVLGDNRANSTDSREIGMINNENILGKCIFRVYPFERFGVPVKND